MIDSETKARIEEAEKDFQKAWNAYWHQETTKKGQLKQWHKMWNLIYDCCLNIGKSKCNGLHVIDLEGKCMDATCNIMNRIEQGCHPGKLSSYVYLFVIGQVWSVKHIRWERSVNIDDIANNIKYSCTDIVTLVE